MRSYENDLCRLSLVGDVSFQQALTAAASDGGSAADEHIVEGLDTMVVETLFPGNGDERSTVSTRLFLPALKVKEKAQKLIRSLPADMLSSTKSKNILAMTFRQVVLQQILSFELQLFGPGSERNMKDLENQRQVSTASMLSSSNEQVLAVLAEAVCMYALEKTELNFREGTLGRNSKSLFDWGRKPRAIASTDSSVILYEISQDELVKNSDSYLAKFGLMETSSPRELRRKYSRWMSSTYSKLEKIGGPEFVAWISDYVPAYRLQVDATKLKNMELEGWNKCAANRWEVLLTHSQMVDLADVLDIYYDDVYTIPDKQLSCRVVTDFKKLAKNKSGTSLWKKLGVFLVGGLFVVSCGILAQLYQSRFYGTRKYSTECPAVPLSETQRYEVPVLDESELEAFCIMIVKKIKDGVGWPGDIMTDINFGAWTGELPSYLRKLHDRKLNKQVPSTIDCTDSVSSGDVPSPLDMSKTAAPFSDQFNTDIKTSAQDIASYQVVLSKDGNIVGFQPTSGVAVNHWASNPLAKALYSRRKLTPGLFEPGLKIQRPEQVVLIELLMSVNPESWFALARPLQEIQ